MTILSTNHPSINPANVIRLHIVTEDTIVVPATSRNPTATKCVTKHQGVVDTVGRVAKVAKEATTVAALLEDTVALVAREAKEVREATMEVDLNSMITAVKPSVTMTTTTPVAAVVLLATVTAMVLLVLTVTVVAVAAVATATVSAQAVAVVATGTMEEVPRITVPETVTKSVMMSSATAAEAVKVAKEEKVVTMAEEALVDTVALATVAREAKEARVVDTILLPSCIKNVKLSVTNPPVILRRTALPTIAVILPRRNRNVIRLHTATDTTVVPNTSLHHL